MTEPTLNVKVRFDSPVMRREWKRYCTGSPDGGLRAAIMLGGLFLSVTMIGRFRTPIGFALGGALIPLSLLVALRWRDWMAMFRLRAIRQQHQARQRELESIEIGPSTLVCRTSGRTATLPLTALHSVERLNSLLVVHLAEEQTILIPDDADFGRDTFETFAGKLQELQSRAKAAASDRAPN
jgi:hypothetical protein